MPATVYSDRVETEVRERRGSMRSPNIHVTIDLGRVRESAERIRRRTGVAVIAVVKADAYGLGAVEVCDILAPVVSEFAYFSIHEARQVGRPGIVMGPPQGDPAWYAELKVRPAIANRRDAERFSDLSAVLNLDTGMQRFGCPPEQAADILRHYNIREAMSHCTSAAGAAVLRNVCHGRVDRLHAAASSLLDAPDTWLDAVRPGLALYQGAVRVTGTLLATRPTRGPVGYTGFEADRVGVLPIGYAHALRLGPVVINARRQRLLEIGMNTSFVSVDAADREGDEVVLLGSELPESALAEHFGTRPHEILCRYTAMGRREYLPHTRSAATATSAAPCTTPASAANPPQRALSAHSQ